MCLAKAYLESDGGKELLLEDVALVEIEGRKLRIATLFGDEKEVEGVIRAIDFQDGSLVVERDA